MATFTKNKAVLPEKEVILRDYKIARISREASLRGRQDVFFGRGKFGIFGDGKEVAQVALAHFFKKGDFRSGYYRDQTILFAQGILSVKQFFAQLYADFHPGHDPFSQGRQMNNHYATPIFDEKGNYTEHTKQYNHIADLAPIAAQMPRIVGLTQASVFYRQREELRGRTHLSNNGNEVIFGTIGNAGCAEGIFWETINAIGIIQGPAVISIWDDGYGISVPNEYQIAKEDIGEILQGFAIEDGKKGGYLILKVKGWDYPALYQTYKQATETARDHHIPVIVHVEELTQPQGHSTSGSHERYKPKERLEWEKEFDCLKKMREWMVAEKIATEEQLDFIDQEAKEFVRKERDAAWEELQQPIREEKKKLFTILEKVIEETGDRSLKDRMGELDKKQILLYRNLLSLARETKFIYHDSKASSISELNRWIEDLESRLDQYVSTHLYSSTPKSPLNVKEIKPVYSEDSPVLYAFEVLNRFFDKALAKYPEMVIFGEDVGHLGDVNQACAGLQKKYSKLRVFDTGIREATILGQGIGLALRGFKPIAEIQYLDYLLYALQIISDDLATLRYRTAGIQGAPVIIRTRGHRLEGIWHTGSLMGGILNLVRGVWVCVPRNMTQAAGMYNTLLQGDDPAIVVEVLNGYRLKEKLPDNIGEFNVPLGIPEVLREGKDITIVTYGACCRIAQEACKLLSRKGIDAELIDIQTLTPFDRPNTILESVKKTSRLLIVDEDVPGGASAYILDQLIKRDIFWWLDREPFTLTGRAHRHPYGSDGDYVAKPNREDIVEAAENLVKG